MNDQKNLVSINSLNIRQIASICDHTFLQRSESFKPIAKQGQSPIQLRNQALYSFLKETLTDKDRVPYAVCIRPEDVTLVSEFLYGRKIIIASVAGFPDGSLYETDLKVAETQIAINNGAKEIDMVLNYERLKAGDIAYVKEDIRSVTEKAHELGALVKLIFETSELNADQIKHVCEIANEAEVDFAKTSTGFSAYGARAEDLRIMRAYFARGVKISGGVSVDNVKSLLKAASGRDDGYINLNPNLIRIGESSLLAKLL